MDACGTLCAVKIAALVVAVALSGSAQAQAQEAREDPLLPPEGACAHESNVEAHHRLQRIAMHCLLAELRENADLPRLRSSTFLRHSATYKARRIADCKIFSHYPCGDKLAAPFKQASVTTSGRWLVGENLAYGVGDESSPRNILAKWLASPTHRAVLEDDRFSHVGLRRRRLRMKGAPVGSVIWVVHVGRPRSR